VMAGGWVDEDVLVRMASAGWLVVRWMRRSCWCVMAGGWVEVLLARDSWWFVG